MKILVVDDDRVGRLVAGAAVTRLGHEAVLAASGEEAWAAYQDHGADVVLTDWVMPGMGGRELCRRIRAEPDASYTYIAVVSSVSDRGDAMAAMEAGADDYIAKPLDQGDLAVRLVVATRVTVLHRRLAHHRHELRRLHREEAVVARTDSLTGLRNRRSMDEELAILSARARRYEHHYWLMLCDLDRFHDYNTEYGHRAGDDVLATVAAALRDGVREGDSVFRYGGEEFLAVLTEASLTSALETAERVRRQVEGLQIPHPGNVSSGVVTISLGLTALAGSVSMAVERADSALFAAKAGRNQVAWHLETDLVSVADLPVSVGSDRRLVLASVVPPPVVAMPAQAPPGTLGAKLERGVHLHSAVHQAAGMVAVQCAVGLTEAMVLLRAYSFSHDRSLTDVARDVVDRMLRFDGKERASVRTAEGDAASGSVCGSQVGTFGPIRAERPDIR